MQTIILRSEAKSSGLTHYFTGKPCPNGHVGRRNTKSGNCVDCTTAWHLANPQQRTRWKRDHRDVGARQYRNWSRNNPAHVKARNAEYRATKLKATPKWLTKEQRAEIRRIYANCPSGYHVDHIVPLKGKNVCGWHVPWNLQYLPARINLSKRNKLTD